MTKIQKIWLWIFLAMFIVPEIILSPVLGLLPFNNHFRSTDDNHLALTIVVLAEFVGLLVSSIMVFKFAKYRWKNIVVSCCWVWRAGRFSFFIYYT